MATVAGMCAQARTKYADFSESHIEVIQDEVISVGEMYRLTNAGDGRAKGDLEPQQRQELLNLMTELCQMQQEATCRSKALEAVEVASASRRDQAEVDLEQVDLPALYQQEVDKAMEKRKPLDQEKYMKHFEKKLGGSGASAAADDEDSDDDIEVETAPGGDPDREFKCPLSGYFQWLEDPVRNAGCNGSRACVYSKAGITAHVRKGANAGHQFPRCPIQGCNAYIKDLNDLQVDRDMAKKVKQAKRSAERREAAAAADEDDDAVDMTQD
jgi:hypothetical protein